MNKYFTHEVLISVPYRQLSESSWIYTFKPFNFFYRCEKLTNAVYNLKEVLVADPDAVVKYNEYLRAYEWFLTLEDGEVITCRYLKIYEDEMKSYEFEDDDSALLWYKLNH